MPLTDICRGSTIGVRHCWLVEAAGSTSPGPVSLSSVSRPRFCVFYSTWAARQVLTLGSLCRELSPLHSTSTTALLPCRLLSFKHDVFLGSEV